MRCEGGAGRRAAAPSPAPRAAARRGTPRAFCRPPFDPLRAPWCTVSCPVRRPTPFTLSHTVHLPLPPAAAPVASLPRPPCPRSLALPRLAPRIALLRAVLSTPWHASPGCRACAEAPACAHAAYACTLLPCCIVPAPSLLHHANALKSTPAPPAPQPASACWPSLPACSCYRLLCHPARTPNAPKHLITPALPTHYSAATPSLLTA